MGSEDCFLGDRQCTIARAIACTGVGLHSGVTTTVRLVPAPAGTGRCFVRTDLPNAPTIPAQVSAVQQTVLSTELVAGTAQVRTVEHLLAALFGFGIDNVHLEIDGGEVPLLDGSAQDWATAITQAGVAVQSAPRPQWELTEPIWVRQGDAFVAALPAPELRFSYGIDFDVPAIGNQWHSWAPSQCSFLQDIAPARTFGLAHQIEHLQAAGLIKGGSLENALVCSQTGWLNPPLRFSNEPVRHKLLDLVGDLSLVGYLPKAHYLAYKASHHLHTQLAQQLAAIVNPG
ncbi:UDP-3-O-acyl-N-acetylglucosamine deacetylase [Alkalinema sp. FACHB-956]|uniref:UDP-3-O-acyl-N-acetylglucosamine deacetylase n=1 Tax=Alkalinema sp. FACHB-956 TaxID=2692768 RepID=UPI0016865338|nr:UDP-3-O-acyl-N-acetylglucosamine deacetylase [Alkalinema sp. FACHB-956]MBD2327618.1 UDP-3-O-acyl-N-acetylglucosamine deacetylase [Alkalinema sp. FACHB-956]